MGTSAYTKISNKHDYIDTYTRYDGFLDQMEASVVNASVNWGNGLNEFNKRLNAKPYKVEYMEEWSSELGKFLSVYKTNPTIESITSLYCLKSLISDQLSINGLGYGHNIDYKLKVFLKDDNSIIINNDKYKTEVVHREISPEFKVGRISLFRDQNFNSPHYIDFKFKDIDTVELVKQIIALPQFFRNLYSVIKLKDQEIEDDKTLLNLQIFNYNHLLSYFSKGTNEYFSPLRLDKSPEGSLPRSREQKEKEFDKVISKIQGGYTFSLWENGFLNHLLLRFPNKVLPITEAEKGSEYSIDLNIGIIDKDAKDIVINIPDKDLKFHSTLINEIVFTLMEKENEFNEQHGLIGEDPVIGIHYLSPELSEIPYLGFAYEYNFASLMSNQYEIEVLENI